MGFSTFLIRLSEKLWFLKISKLEENIKNSNISILKCLQHKIQNIELLIKRKHRKIAVTHLSMEISTEKYSTKSKRNMSQPNILSAHSKDMHDHSNTMTQEENPRHKGEMVSHEFG